jgi:hypothetical protein
MMGAAVADYEAVIAEAAAAETESEAVRRRTVARLRRELQRIGRRDFFPPVEREAAQQAVVRLAETVMTA